MKLVFGIGNPGDRYYFTYHNLGVLFLDFMLKNFKIISFKKKSMYDYFVLEDFCILKSKVYMNCSYDALREIYTFYKLRPTDVCVVHDELGLEKFKVNFKTTQGLNGHNGLRHIAQNIGPTFFRLRFGIDYPNNNKLNVADYVLSNLSIKDWEEPFIEGVNLLNNCFFIV